MPIEEHDGFVWAWYHPHGEPPSFPVQTFDEIASGEWTDYRKREWTISTHVQETGENAVDSAHFLAVHGVPDLLARPDVRFDGHLRVSDLAMELTRITDQKGVEKGRYVDGKEEGPWKRWYDNGQLEAEGNYVRGTMVGFWVGFHKNGQKMYEGQFEAGKRPGDWVGWHDNGQKEFEAKAENGGWVGAGVGGTTQKSLVEARTASS